MYVSIYISYPPGPPASKQSQNIFDVEPKLYKCYTNILRVIAVFSGTL